MIFIDYYDCIKMVLIAIIIVQDTINLSQIIPQHIKNP